MQIVYEAYPGQTLTLFLEAEATGTGTPNPAGYASTESNGRYSTGSITGLAGEFFVWATDPNDEIAFTGYVTVADDSGVYRCYPHTNASVSVSGTGLATAAVQNQILNALTSGAAQTSAPVTTGGHIKQIVRGDDYLLEAARAFKWTVDAPTHIALVDAECYFGGGSPHKGAWLVSGTVSDIGGGKWEMSFELTNAITECLLPGEFRWSAELRGPAPEHITKILGTTKVVESYTKS